MTQAENQNNSIKQILIVFLFITAIYLMYVLQAILIPLFMALLIAIMFQPIIQFLKKIRTPNWLLLPTISIITLGILVGLYFVIGLIVDDLIINQDIIIRRLNIKLDSVLRWINSTTGLRFSAQNDFGGIFRFFTKSQMTKTAGGIANYLGGFTTTFATFAIYYIVLLAGISNYKDYVTYIAKKENSTLLINFEKIQRSIYQYMIIKTALSLFTGTIVYFICIGFGINFAFLWAFLTFILNYIPSVGSIASTLLPSLMAFIQFDEMKIVVVFLFTITIIHFIIGNVLEPIIMGDRMNLNTLSVIFSLVFWGYLWGIPGMILSVPLIFIVKLIFEHVPSMEIFARMLGKADKESNESDVELNDKKNVEVDNVKVTT